MLPHIKKNFKIRIAAIEAIYQSSKGVLRKANLIAHYSLMACAGKKTQIVDADHVREAIEEIS